MHVHKFRAGSAAFAILSMMATTGCSKQGEQPNSSAEERVQNGPAPVEVRNSELSPAADAAVPEPQVQPEKADIPPELPVSRNEQMLDDAEASGMTSRLPQASDEPGNGSSSGNTASR